MLVEYNPKTGSLYWKPASKRSGPAFNSKHSGGYRYGMYKGTIYYQHRVCWAVYWGVWPSGEIDHDNHIRDDNRMVNLFDVTHQQNTMHRKSRLNLDAPSLIL